MAAKETANRRSGRKKRVITACAHTNLSHYAMGMCNHCYHKYGRNALATDCAHAGQRKVYAKGKCQSCYINDYNKMRRREKKQEKKQVQSEQKVLKEAAQTAECLSQCDQDHSEKEHAQIVTVTITSPESEVVADKS